MSETIIYVVLWIVNTAVIVAGNVLSYHFGVKHGVNNAVIKVLKDEEILNEISDEE